MQLNMNLSEGPPYGRFTIPTRYVVIVSNHLPSINASFVPQFRIVLDARLGWAEIPLDLPKHQCSKKRLFLTGFLPPKKIGNPSHPQKEPADFFIACM